MACIINCGGEYMDCELPIIDIVDEIIKCIIKK